MQFLGVLRGWLDSIDSRVPFGVKKLGAACGIMITGPCVETLFPFHTDGVTQLATIPR
jgi:hypothetical protein